MCILENAIDIQNRTNSNIRRFLNFLMSSYIHNCFYVIIESRLLHYFSAVSQMFSYVFTEVILSTTAFERLTITRKISDDDTQNAILILCDKFASKNKTVIETSNTKYAPNSS